MALKDFFTLTEMKDGISTPDRVEELINLMGNHKDKDVKNAEEASRQQCTAVRTIACTDNKVCLDRFVQLGGLSFINTWLNDIHSGASDIPDGFMDDYLIALLQALEKLPVDDEKLTSSGVGITLKSLIVHNSSGVKDRVYTLLDSWKLKINTSEVNVNVMEEMSVHGCTNVIIKSDESNSMETSHLDLSNQRKSTSRGCISGTPDSLLAENVKDVLNPENGTDTEVVTLNTPDCGTVKDVNLVTQSTDKCKGDENVSIKRSTSAGAGTGLTDIRNESHSNSNRKEGQSFKQIVEVVADVGTGENRITTATVEQFRDEEQSAGACFPESDSGSLRSDDAEVEHLATKAVQKDLVMVPSEGMDIPEPALKPAQEKMLDGPTPTVQNYTSSPQAALSSKEITAKDEDGLKGLKPSHANPVVQETEIETRAVLGFDLNEEVISEDLDTPAVQNQDLNCDAVDQRIINNAMATSVISASGLAAVSEPPASLLQFEEALRFKGSAATSAFQPAPPHKPLESNNATSSSGPGTSLNERDVDAHDFDLNMVDAENSENTPDSIIAVSSSHPSEESCVEIGPSKSKRAELDLNRLGDAPPAFWRMNGMPFSQQNAYRSPSPASSSSSVHPSMWDLDLNKKFSVPNLVRDPPPCPGNSTLNFFEGHGIRKSPAPDISIMGAKVDVGKVDSFLWSPPYPNANNTGFQNFLPPSTNPSPQQPLFMYRPGNPVTVFDPRGSHILPHMIGPAQPPYLISMMGAPPTQVPISIAPHSYSTFDPNMLYMNDAANRNEPPHARQYLMTTQGGFLEPHSTPVSQPPSFLTKRKEPHDGWDPYQHGFINNHHESPGSKS